MLETSYHFPDHTSIYNSREKTLTDFWRKSLISVSWMEEAEWRKLGGLLTKNRGDYPGLGAVGPEGR
jgi:hypothetical protein